MHHDTQDLNAVLDNLGEFVVRWLPSGIRTYVNKAYCDYYNLSKSQALGSSFFPHIALEDLNRVKQRISLLSVDSPTSSAIHRVYHPNGSIGWQEWTDTAIFDNEGVLLEYQSVGRDITERMEIENELIAHRERLESLVEERTRELVSANKELESFGYSVSHDLRAPLRSIDAFSCMLLDEYSAALDENAASYIAKIRLAVLRMGNLIDDLLKLARISQEELSVEPVNLSTIVKGLAGHFNDSNPDRCMDVIIKDDVVVYGDTRLLEIVLTNLFANACKYTSQSERPRIEFGSHELSGDNIIFLRDNGVGFDMGDANKLFQAFSRLHKDKQFKGTGVGLAIVKRIIQRHGGKIWAEAEEGEGATFYFTLSKELGRDAEDASQRMGNSSPIT